MSNNQLEGLPFVVEVEGTDGSGKTTALDALYNDLTALGLKVLKTKDIGNPYLPKSIQLRQIALDPTDMLDPISMELVFAAVRVMNYDFLKKLPDIDEVDVVLSGRGWLTHLAYSEANVGLQVASDLYQSFLEQHSHLPDVVVLIKTDPEIAMERRRQRNERNGITQLDAIESKGQDYQVAVAKNFDKYVGQYQDIFNVIVVDGNGDQSSVGSQLKVIAGTIKSQIDSYPGFSNKTATGKP
jgi:dTMP kinase